LYALLNSATILTWGRSRADILTYHVKQEGNFPPSSIHVQKYPPFHRHHTICEPDPQNIPFVSVAQATSYQKFFIERNHQLPYPALAGVAIVPKQHTKDFSVLQLTNVGSLFVQNFSFSNPIDYEYTNEIETFYSTQSARAGPKKFIYDERSEANHTTFSYLDILQCKSVGNIVLGRRLQSICRVNGSVTIPPSDLNSLYLITYNRAEIVRGVDNSPVSINSPISLVDKVTANLIIQNCEPDILLDISSINRILFNIPDNFIPTFSVSSYPREKYDLLSPPGDLLEYLKTDLEPSPAQEEIISNSQYVDNSSRGNFSQIEEIMIKDGQSHAQDNTSTHESSNESLTNLVERLKSSSAVTNLQGELLLCNTITWPSNFVTHSYHNEESEANFHIIDSPILKGPVQLSGVGSWLNSHWDETDENIEMILNEMGSGTPRPSRNRSRSEDRACKRKSSAISRSSSVGSFVSRAESESYKLFFESQPLPSQTVTPRIQSSQSKNTNQTPMSTKKKRKSGF
jgi:hypothetical protein